MVPQRFPPVVFFLLMTNFAMFVAGPALGLERLFAQYLPLYALGSPWFQVWQPVSYAFLHADAYHLGFNMFALWMFGRTIEEVWGSQRFAWFYLVCIVGAAAVQLAVAYFSADLYSRTIGASGGVFGILLAFGMTFPNQRIMLLFPPIPMKAKYFVIGYGALELYLGLTRVNSSIAHFAHLGGMVFGLILILYWRATRQIRR
ncbi:MAG: rhomboid family intramembrane serine protease [Pseudomonadota bacterium]